MELTHGHFINRELSWLSFNERVFQEAEDKTVPLIERLRFLGIFSNNRDEFFRVRVANLSRTTMFKKNKQHSNEEDPNKVLNQIYKTILKEQIRFDALYEEIRKELADNNIFFLTDTQLTEKDGHFVKDFFYQQLMPLIFPIVLNDIADFPAMKDKLGYLIIKLGRKDNEKKSKYALIEIPTNNVSRFLILPPQDNKEYIILLDDVIRYCVSDIFRNFTYDYVEAYNIKITRDAEIDLDNDLSKNLVDKLSKGLKKRKKGQPIRLVYDKEISPAILDFIIKKNKLGKKYNAISGGRYHNFSDFIAFPKIGNPSLFYVKKSPLPHPYLPSKQDSTSRSYFHCIQQKDILLSYPYHSFNHILDLLREASIDPRVYSIKITLYRVAKNANLINALINAVKNGKRVTVVVEVRARFDEEANIDFANQLHEEGAKVIFGVPGLKVHSKLLLIKRKKNNIIEAFAHIGTGNFNSDTVAFYTDHTLLTADPRITNEVDKLFDFYANNLKIGKYQHLLVSPFFLRTHLIKLIRKEIKHANENKNAFIILKMNGLVDMDLIKTLYEASNKGVKIKLIVRGKCALVPGIKGLSDNIEAISIIDKYLEHSRIFIFHNGGDDKYFLSSADWMERNMDFRSEVAVPIYDDTIKKQIKDVIDILWSDNTKARLLNQARNNEYRHAHSIDLLAHQHTPKLNTKKIRAQDALYDYFQSFNNITP